MRNIDEVIIHCSATQPHWMEDQTTSAKVNEIRRWHKARGWRDIGYHLIIDRDGSTAMGRKPSEVGAHVKGRNKTTLGVCLIGGHGSAETDRFADHYTQAQNDTLRMVLRRLQNEYPTIKKISGHNEYAAKACPGFNVQRWLNNRPPERKSVAQSTTLQATAATAVAGATGVGTAVGALDGTAQIILIGAACVAALGLVWIARERLKRWAKGDR